MDNLTGIGPDDFCLIHGYEGMRSRMGDPVPYCEDCEREKAMDIAVSAREPVGNCEAPNGAGHTTADCPGAECRRTGQCQVA